MTIKRARLSSEDRRAKYKELLTYYSNYLILYSSTNKRGGMNKNRSHLQNDAPYSNMQARKTVLILGFTLSVASFVMILLGCLLLFVPSIKFSSDTSPSVTLMWMFIAGIIASFTGTVFTVAGANTIRQLASFSMFLSSLSFIVGAAVLVIILFFRTVLPLDAIDKLAACVMPL